VNRSTPIVEFFVGAYILVMTVFGFYSHWIHYFTTFTMWDFQWMIYYTFIFIVFMYWIVGVARRSYNYDV